MVSSFSGPGACGRARARRRCASPGAAGACHAGRRRIAVVRGPAHAADVEERGVHRVSAVGEGGAEHAAALVAHVPAEARALVPAPGQVRDPLQEGVGDGPVARLPVADQRLERVAAQQLVVQLGVLRRPRDEVETDHAGAVQHQHALLAVLQRERGQHGVEVCLAHLVGVAHGPRRRRGRVPSVQLVHLVPHPALVRPVTGARHQRRVDALLHRVAHLTVGHDLALRELARRVGPAPLLGAADRDDQVAVPADEDGGVEDAVLLGAAQLLAVEHENALVSLVDDAQLRHRAALAHLGDHRLLPADGLTQGDVAGAVAGAEPQREHRQRSVGLALPQSQRLHQGGATEHLVVLRHDTPPSPWPPAGPARPASGASS